MYFTLIEFSTAFGKKNIAKNKDGSVNFTNKIMKFSFDELKVAFWKTGCNYLFLIRYSSFNNGIRFEIKLLNMIFYTFETITIQLLHFPFKGE
jgi:uncharacterized protein YdaL